MRILSVLGILLVLSISAFMLKESGYRGGAVFVLFGVSTVFSLLPEYIETISPFLSSFFTSSASDAISAILKISGIGILSEITAEICESLGERILSRVTSVMLRLEILIIVIPYFEDAVAAIGGVL